MKVFLPVVCGLSLHMDGSEEYWQHAGFWDLFRVSELPAKGQLFKYVQIVKAQSKCSTRVFLIQILVFLFKALLLFSTQNFRWTAFCNGCFVVHCANFVKRCANKIDNSFFTKSSIEMRWIETFLTKNKNKNKWQFFHFLRRQTKSTKGTRINLWQIKMGKKL